MTQPHSDEQVSLSGFSDATVQHVQPSVSSPVQTDMAQSMSGGVVFQNHAGANTGSAETPLTQNMAVHSDEYMPSDVFKGQDSVAKAAAFDTPASNMTPTTSTAAQNFNIVQTTTPHSLHIQNAAGMTEAAITQTSPGHVVFQDPMGMHIGSATVQPGIGDVAIHGADHMIEGLLYVRRNIKRGGRFYEYGRRLCRKWRICNQSPPREYSCTYQRRRDYYRSAKHDDRAFEIKILEVTRWCRHHFYMP